MYEKVYDKMLMMVNSRFFLIIVFKYFLLLPYPPSNTHILVTLYYSLMVCDLYSTFSNYN